MTLGITFSEDLSSRGTDLWITWSIHRTHISRTCAECWALDTAVNKVQERPRDLVVPGMLQGTLRFDVVTPVFKSIRKQGPQPTA